MFHALQLESVDNVATVVADIAKGSVITVQAGARAVTLSTLESIPFGHKIALQPIKRGEVVTKYGRPIGRALIDVAKGGLIGAHNIEGMRGRGDLAIQEGEAE
ncbi:MAG: UxaA family hydrolase [Candidatus Korobacteraceae bacterium]|jgi:altronate dehydratase small subunit